MDRLLNKADVVEITCLSYPTIWSKMRAGTFPRSFKLGEGKFGRIAWREEEIAEWLNKLPRSILKGDKKRRG